MACLLAIRHTPVLKSFYRRLREDGKSPRLTLVTAMCKLHFLLRQHRFHAAEAVNQDRSS
jgi:hypothetical protein